MTVNKIPRFERWSLATFVRRFPQVHLGIGLLGNALFVVGSVLFMQKIESVSLYFFVFGSSGMFLGTLGELLRALGRRKLWQRNVDPANPDQRWSKRERDTSRA